MGQAPTDEDMAEMFLELDHDNSGGIDFTEVPVKLSVLLVSIYSTKKRS
jgi:Ca2+-binding EF-hand superfamily protein